jgi:hypothetical protein
MLQLPSSTAIVGVFFDHEGNLLEVQKRRIDDPEDGTYFEAIKEWERAAEAWRAELRFEPAVIRVYRFDLDGGGGIEDFPWPEGSMDPDQWLQREIIQDEWLPEGRFVFRWGNVYWINRQGAIDHTYG